MMETLRRLGSVLLAAVFLGGCAGIEVEQYRTEKPQLDLRKFFSGKVIVGGLGLLGGAGAGYYFLGGDDEEEKKKKEEEEKKTKTPTGKAPSDSE